jgi:type IV secretory pathway component VirB8
MNKQMAAGASLSASALTQITAVPAPAPKQTVYEEALSWDASRVLAQEKSEQRAWKLAWLSVLVTVLSWVALVLLLPLKRTEPYLIRVDSATGVPDIITTLKAEDVGAEEVTQKFFLADYVRARETYDWNTLQVDYDKTRLYSSPVLAKEYAKLFEGDGALDKKYGAKIRATVQIQSVVPTSSTTGTVRFSKTTKHLEDSSPGQETRWVATIAFRFNSPTKLRESERLINPFGFQVISYRVDPELVGGSK